LAERALAAAAAGRDVEAEVAARYALGWAQHVLGDADAGKTLTAGIKLAERHGDWRGAGLLRRHLAFQLAEDGHLRAAQREIATAIALLSGRERAQSQVHRVDIHRRSRSVDAEAHRRVVADAARALRLLRRDGDAIWEARLLFNRGLLHLDRGGLDRAHADLNAARELFARAGANAMVVETLTVLGGIALLRGDVLGCLKTLEDAQASVPPETIAYNLDHWRVLALAQARLLPEARAAAEEYVALCTRTGHADHESVLTLASIALMSGDASAARRLATSAAKSFAARRKPLKAALARSASLHAQLLEGAVRRSSVRTGLEAAATLEAGGWRRDALRTRLLVARIALAAGSLATARDQFELARPLRSQGTVADRVELSYVDALLRCATGDVAGAERRLLHGLRLLDQYRAALGALELRATASGLGNELAQRGLALAIESNHPAKVLAWSERLRANALRLPPVQPPADRKLRDLQTELRRATAAGRATGEARLEAAIRARARLVDAVDGTPSAMPSVRTAADRLGEQALVEYVEVDGALYALTLAGGRLTLHELGATQAAAELDWLRFAYGRIAAGRMTATQRAATFANAVASSTALDELLIEPLRADVGEAPLVLVPTGALHALPWAALPSLKGRPLVLAPSLGLWSDLAARPRSQRRKTALVAGPRLRHAAREVRELAALRPGATVLHGKAATAKATLAALDGVAIAHLACHGHFRADSPLFSSLELADGPLNVYELQQLRRAPEVVVLSACDLALSQTHPGDELLGLAAALLGMGTRTIVASVVPVPDAAARRVMLAFHGHLLSGLTPAAALARAQVHARTAGFVCLGSG
jgi:CHAT domain-containing protein